MKKLYYEILPPDETDDLTDITEGKSDGATKSNEIIEVEPQAKTAVRDRFAEFGEAVKKIKRVRFRIAKQNNDTAAVTVFITAVVLVGGLFMLLNKTRMAQIIIGSIMAAAIVIAVAVMIALTAKSHVPHYCYFAADARGIFCLSDTGDSATVFAYGAAYHIKGDEFYTWNGDTYKEFYDGMGAGMVSLMSAKREDVEFEDDETLNCYVKNRVGGGHRVVFDGGDIVEITSENPRYTDDIDAKTGERVIKLDVYIKTEPTDVFAWEIPEKIKNAFEANGVTLPDMSGL